MPKYNSKDKAIMSGRKGKRKGRRMRRDRRQR